jgi:hypothetical protein
VTDAPTYPVGLVPRVQPPGSVGDVNSNAKGSGARFNAGKAPLDLIPLRFIAESYKGRLTGDAEKARLALADLGEFQETGKDCHLYRALNALGPIVGVWRDCAKAFDYGRGKYAEWNWAKGMAWSIPLACAARHCLAIMEAEHEGNLDPESKCPHRGHIACNVVMLLQFLRTFPEGNDRPTMLSAAA